MEASVCIEQKGIVEEITDRYIKVSIRRDAACGHCHVKGMCTLGDESRRSIEIANCRSELSIGEEVNVVISRNMGNKAVILAYLLPFILLITALVVFQTAGTKEWLTGVLALMVLIPYYLILYLFRNRLQRTFNFSVRKIAL